MAHSKTFFDIQDSYIEIENYVIINLNPVTGSISEYEDYEFSAESFLMELNTMKMLPSLKMPVLETSRVVEKAVATSGQEKMPLSEDNAGVNKGGSSRDVRDPSDNRETKAQRKRVWEETRRNLTAGLEAENDDSTPSNTPESDTALDIPEREASEHNDSLHGEGSESPHTDPDFPDSSSDGTDVEWILRSGMVGLRVNDSLFTVEEEGAKSVRGVIHGRNGKVVEENSEDGDKTMNKKAGVEEGVSSKTDAEHGNRDTEASDRLDKEKNERDTRRRELRNVSLAASATAAMIAAIWMMERSAA